MDNTLEELKKLLHFKKSHAFYAERLGISEEEVKSLLNELRGKEDIRIEGSQKATESIVIINNDKGTFNLY
jgi:DNA-binding transcriptional regulator LsrR (DeoR family)